LGVCIGGIIDQRRHKKKRRRGGNVKITRIGNVKKDIRS
jgi:hypothetical protein